MDTRLCTIRDFLRYAMTEFAKAQVCFGHGTDNAWDEAIALILPSLHLPLDMPPTLLDAHLTATECALLYDVLERRIVQRIPTAYITQQAWFAELSFYVDPRVLIPRSPLAEIIEQEFAPWIAPERVEKVLDLCTGSGSLAIVTALTFPDSQVCAVDIDTDALCVATINVEKHNVADQVSLLQSDVFSAVRGTYDVIISNPPYVSAQEYATLPPEYHHEPAVALTTADDGLAVVATLLARAAEYLTPHGILLVEVGNSEETVRERYAHLPFIWLSFTRGGGGVFLLTAEALRAASVH